MKTLYTSALLIITSLSEIASAPLESAFTYQGRLTDGTTLATGSYEFGFYLYDAATSGNQIGNPIFPPPLSVSNGLFSATLDFGKDAMDGNARWLEIHVRTNGSADPFKTLLPRQPMLAAPYAFFARTAGSLKGTLPDAQLSTNVARLDGSQTFSGLPTFAASGSPFSVLSSATVSNLNADLLDVMIRPRSH